LAQGSERLRSPSHSHLAAKRKLCALVAMALLAPLVPKPNAGGRSKASVFYNADEYMDELKKKYEVDHEIASLMGAGQNQTSLSQCPRTLPSCSPKSLPRR